MNYAGLRIICNIYLIIQLFQGVLSEFKIVFHWNETLETPVLLDWIFGVGIKPHFRQMYLDKISPNSNKNGRNPWTILRHPKSKLNRYTAWGWYTMDTIHWNKRGVLEQLNNSRRQINYLTLWYHCTKFLIEFSSNIIKGL